MIGKYDWRKEAGKPDIRYLHTPIGRIVLWEKDGVWHGGIEHGRVYRLGAKTFLDAADESLDAVRKSMVETKAVLKKIGEQNAWWRKSREPKKEQDCSGAHF